MGKDGAGKTIVPSGNHVAAGAGRSSAALHEASHSVARQLLVGDLERVWVKNDGSGKSEHPQIDVTALSKEELSNQVVIIFAGIHAERELIKDHALTERVIALDYKQANAVRKYGEFSEEEMEKFEAEAHDFVLAYEREIRAVAKQLNRRGRLRGEQVNQIVMACESKSENHDQVTV